MLEAPYKEIKSECPEELFYADGLALVSEPLDSLKGRPEAWKRAFELKGLRINIKMKKANLLVCNCVQKGLVWSCIKSAMHRMR